MRCIHIVFAAFISGSIFVRADAFAQPTPQPPARPPSTAAAEVTACAQAQMVVDSLLTSANARLESARQSNNPADLRAAVDALQTTIRDVRAQLAACANVGAADPHAGHAMPGMKTTEPGAGQPSSPTAKPPAPDPHAGHTPTATAPATKPATPATKPNAPIAKPTAPDPHAGHATTPAKPPSKPAKPSPTKPPAAKAAASAPHAGHTTQAAKESRTTETSAAKPAPSAKPPAADAHVGHGAATTPPSSNGEAVDPVCGLRVDPADAPSTKHAGQTYYFCSTKHRDLFVSNPAKFLPNKQ